MAGLRIDALTEALCSRADQLAPKTPGISRVVTSIVQETGYAERHVWRAVKDYRKKGRLPSIDAFELSDDDIEVIATTRGNVQGARRHLLRLGEHVPSASTWARAAERQIGKRMLASFRTGARGIRDTQIYLKAEDRPRNHTWQMDHAHLPLRVSLGDGGEPVEVWVTSVIDVGTRFLMGWTLSVTRADAVAVREALLMGLYGSRAPDGGRVGGVPELILWDRGLEFLADIVLATTDAFRTLGIALPPFSPHRKGKIERWFRTVKGECIDFLIGSTRGPTDLRGDHYNAMEVVDFEVLLQAFSSYVDHYNFERVHSELGRTPWEAWQADTTAIRPAPAHAVYDAMARASRRYKVTKRGVTFRGGTYKADKLADVNGLTVEVRYIPNDLDSIEVFRDGRHLCTAIESDAMSADDRVEFIKDRSTSRRSAQDLRRRMQKRKVQRANEHLPASPDDGAAEGSLAASGEAAFASLFSPDTAQESAQLELL
jgi:putative transposase